MSQVDAEIKVVVVSKVLSGTNSNEKRAFPDKWKIASRHYAVNGAFILHGSVNRPQNEQPFHIIVG